MVCDCKRFGHCIHCKSLGAYHSSRISRVTLETSTDSCWLSSNPWHWSVSWLVRGSRSRCYTTKLQNFAGRKLSVGKLRSHWTSSTLATRHIHQRCIRCTCRCHFVIIRKSRCGLVWPCRTIYVVYSGLRGLCQTSMTQLRGQGANL